jgi:hypothetical protein
VAFEALAWGRFVDDYRRAWRIVQLQAYPDIRVVGELCRLGRVRVKAHGS